MIMEELEDMVNYIRSAVKVPEGYPEDQKEDYQRQIATGIVTKYFAYHDVVREHTTANPDELYNALSSYHTLFHIRNGKQA
jgi:hypothetical protein